MSQIVVTDSSKSRDHSTNITTTTNQLGATSDGSETKQPIVDDSTSQKSIGGGGSDESESSAATTSNSSSSSRKKKQGEDCDPSYMCSDDQHLFLACLRVPGDDDGQSLSFPLHLLLFYSLILVNADAPHLSLLIKNKAKAALLLTITAPSFVRLETNQVQLPESQDTKVTFSFIFEWLHGGRLNLVNLLRQAYIFVLFFFGR